MQGRGNRLESLVGQEQKVGQSAPQRHKDRTKTTPRSARLFFVISVLALCLCRESGFKALFQLCLRGYAEPLFHAWTSLELNADCGYGSKVPAFRSSDCT